MHHLSDRHAGTLDGLLAPVDATSAASVTVEVAADAAASAAGQHTAWMLINLLARQAAVVDRVTVVCPDGVPLHGRVVALASRDLDFGSALLEGAQAIGSVPVERDAQAAKGSLLLIVGPGPPITGALRVWGERAWGGVSGREVMSADPESRLPLGPYAAACLASAHVFKHVRMAEGRSVLPCAAFYSLWSFAASDAPPSDPSATGPHDVSMPVDVVVAGTGAVGSAWLHAIWATPGLTGRAIIADADKDGVDLSNLNRCVIFGHGSIGRWKASEAKRVCSDADVELVPYDGPVGDVDDRPPLLVSAVDMNTSREAVQALYPAQILSASTDGMRAELLRCDPLAGAPCIRCFNRPEADVPDEDLRRRFLAAVPERQRELADASGQTIEEAIHWATEGTCGYASDRLMDRMRAAEHGTGAFAVGFASVMAGAMLAAQTLKEGAGDGPLTGIVSRAVMTFVDPLALTNAPRAYRRDDSCPMCKPGTIEHQIWVARYEEHLRTGEGGWNDRAA
jgi:molybdopterin/thiamine biosynthesis adenylyltransferase